MTPEKIDYVAMLNDMRAKRAALDASIVALEAALASGTLGQAVEGLGVESATSGSLGRPIDLPAGAFNGKSLPDAVKLYLEAMRQRKTKKEIVNALREGGVVSTSDNFESVVQAALQRMKGLGVLLKFADGWGLSEWYPAGFRSANKTPAKAAKRQTKGKRKAKSKPKASTERRAAEPKAEGPDVSAYGSQKPALRIETFLNSSPGNEFASDFIAREVAISNVKVAEMLLGKLVKKGLIEKTASGAYRSRLREMPKAV